MMDYGQEILPTGWTLAAVGDTGDYINGLAFKESDWHGEGLPIIRIQNLTDASKPFNLTLRDVDPAYIVRDRDILVSWSATLDAFLWLRGDAILNQHIFKVVPQADVVDRFFLYYLLRHTIGLMKQSAHLHGSTMKHINRGPFLSFPIPLPPLCEQQRIVAAIEEQFTRLDAAVAGLKRTQANLKRYRAAVLAAACSGRLVPTEAELAAREGRSYEPADQLLQRILQERRERWEADQLAKMQAQGKVPTNDAWKSKYKEPEVAPSRGEASLPQGWNWSTLGQLISRSEYGTSVKCSYEADGYPVLRIPNIADGRVDLSNLKFATKPLSLDRGDELSSGDLLVCRTNGSVNLIGKAALVVSDLPDPHTFASYLLRFRFIDAEYLSKWVWMFVTAPQGRDFIERNAISSAGQHNISLSLMHRFPVPVPPSAEQIRIAAEVERRMSVIEELEKATASSLLRAERMRQSVLRRAFEGKLVPQDPTDEPADVLLERIRAVRSTMQANGSRRRARPSKATDQQRLFDLNEVGENS